MMTMAAGHAQEPEPPDLPLPAVDRNLQVRNSGRVYQAAGNQYIFNQSSAPIGVNSYNTLPRDTPVFTGRDAELRALIGAVARAAESGETIPVYAIEGMPGVGKSALAIHAGHLLQAYFPEGQFFIDLHAHTAGNRPMEPADALFALLSANGVRPANIPQDIDGRAALWRSHMAGRRALVVIDNADGRWQVQPLLPGAGGCLVMITSRRRLTGLSAHQAAVRLTLGTLPPHDAIALFKAMADRPLDNSDMGAVQELVWLGGYLPLAICLLAARVAAEPHWRIGELVEELAEAKDRLAHMRAEDVAVEAVFDRSYLLLPPTQRRFFRRLGLHPGSFLDHYAAAALVGVTPTVARQHLEALYHDHLLDQPVRGRYRMHDLINQYASVRVAADPLPNREAAVIRLVDYYRAAARAAARQLSRPGRELVPLAGSAGASSALPPLRTRQQALAWMAAERDNLLACAAVMSALPGHERLTDLAAAMAAYLRLAGPWNHAIALHRAAADAAGRAGDGNAQATALYELGVMYRHTGQYALAEHALRRSAELHERLGQRSGIADALVQLGAARWRAGDPKGATERLDQALALYRSLHDVRGQADVLDELGGLRSAAGEYGAAADALRQALVLHEELADPHGMANALTQLGGAQQLAGEDREAIEALERALVLHERLGDRYGQARALNYLGVVHRDTGDYLAAREALDQALELYRELAHHPGEADVLNQLGVLARLTGNYADAGRMHEEALSMFQRIPDVLGQAEALNNLGELFLVTDEAARALDHHRRALATSQEAGNVREEAHALRGIGRCSLRIGAATEAAEALHRAELIYVRIGAANDAGTVKGLLALCQVDSRQHGT